MGIGQNIKTYRTKANLTQKELADQLHVTYQAVSKWENDESEPSFDTVKDICKILGCSTNELFDFKEEPNTQTEQTQEQKPEKPIEQKVLIGLCDECRKPIFDSNELFIVKSQEFSHYSGRTRVFKDVTHSYCKECNEKRLAKIRLEEKRKKEALLEKLKTQRTHSFIWPSLLAIALIAYGIYSIVNGDSSTGVPCIVASIFAFTFAATMILNNTFLTEMWLEIASWGFVKLPGVIFEFSIDGLIFLITIKALFFLLGISLAILAALFATALAMILSIFVYPFALSKNLQGIAPND